jgi:hypothetical protein
METPFGSGTAEVHSHLGFQPSALSDDPAPAAAEVGSRSAAAGMIARAAEQARRNPLAAAGVAFALGYLVAGRGSAATPVGRARKRLRGAVLAGAAAAVAEEARALLESEEGIAGFLSTFLRRDARPAGPRD